MRSCYFQTLKKVYSEALKRVTTKVSTTGIAQPRYEIACWADFFSLYVDAYGLDPQLVLELPLDEVEHIALNKSAYDSWVAGEKEKAMKKSRKKGGK